MVTFLITSVFLLVVVAVAVYFWQKPRTVVEPERQLPEPERRSLFPASDVSDDHREPDNAIRDAILAQAKNGERAALSAAHQTNDPDFYRNTLNLFLSKAQGAQVTALVSYVCRHELPVTKQLAESFAELFANSPTRNLTAEVLHVAALSDDAETYRQTVDQVVDSWLEGRVELSAQELQTLIESEYWVLSSSTRSSGVGFLLKTTLADVRRKLQLATNNPRTTERGISND